MRIISGSAKGKKIFIPVDKKTRPLKNMVRESIFNILNHSNLLKKEIDKCYVLDLFSGIGSFGLEAISRGAKKVVFYEDYKPAIHLLTKNINNLKFDQKAEVKKINIYNNNSFINLDYKFNIVFIDPPFKDQKIEFLINRLINSKIVNSNTLIILHRHKQSLDNLSDNFKILREEIYGSSKIVFGLINY